MVKEKKSADPSSLTHSPRTPPAPPNRSPKMSSFAVVKQQLLLPSVDKFLSDTPIRNSVAIEKYVSALGKLIQRSEKYWSSKNYHKCWVESIKISRFIVKLKRQHSGWQHFSSYNHRLLSVVVPQCIRRAEQCEVLCGGATAELEMCHSSESLRALITNDDCTKSLAEAACIAHKAREEKEENRVNEAKEQDQKQKQETTVLLNCTLKAIKSLPDIVVGDNEEEQPEPTMPPPRPPSQPPQSQLTFRQLMFREEQAEKEKLDQACESNNPDDFGCLFGSAPCPKKTSIITTITIDVQEHEEYQKLAKELQSLRENNTKLKIEHANAVKKMKQQYDVQIEARKAEKLNARVNQEKANDLDNLLIGSISFETMEDPVVTPAGHVYDRMHISHWIHHNHTDPFTRESLSRRHLNPIRCLKDLVQKYNKPMEMDSSLEEEKEEEEEEEEILSLEEQIQACKRAAVAFKRRGCMDAARSEVKKYHLLREQLELERE